MGAIAVTLVGLYVFTLDFVFAGITGTLLTVLAALALSVLLLDKTSQ